MMGSKKSTDTLAEASVKAAIFMKENHIFASDPIRYDDNRRGCIRVDVGNVRGEFFYETSDDKGAKK
jgi:hypothetical protein